MNEMEAPRIIAHRMMWHGLWPLSFSSTALIFCLGNHLESDSTSGSQHVDRNAIYTPIIMRGGAIPIEL
jgi:hypothetical protein